MTITIEGDYMHEKEHEAIPVALTQAERITVKYQFIRKKIILHFHKGCRILNITKAAAAVIFLLFTVIGILVSHHTGHAMWWLLAWLVLIFLNIFVFVPADYARYLVESKVIPYLNNDEQTEFGEYSIFAEDIDGEEDEDNNESEEEYF